MNNKYVFEALDRTFQDITDCAKPFGAKLILMAGDYKQGLPIKKKAGKEEIISQLLKKS